MKNLLACIFAVIGIILALISDIEQEMSPSYTLYACFSFAVTFIIIVWPTTKQSLTKK